MHQDFFKINRKEWEWDGNLSSSLRKFSDKLIVWNRNIIGNIFRRKARIHDRLNSVHRALASRASLAQLKLESKLRKERNET